MDHRLDFGVPFWGPLLVPFALSFFCPVACLPGLVGIVLVCDFVCCLSGHGSDDYQSRSEQVLGHWVCFNVTLLVNKGRIWTLRRWSHTVSSSPFRALGLIVEMDRVALFKGCIARGLNGRSLEQRVHFARLDYTFSLRLVWIVLYIISVIIIHLHIHPDNR